MAKWLEQMESFIGGGPGGPRRVKAFRWLVLVGLIGAALLLAASLLNVKTVPPSAEQDFSPPQDADHPQQQQQQAFSNGDSKNEDSIAAIESELENRLKQLLETMVGVGTADVFVTVQSTEETVVQLNEKQTQQITDESDRNGAKRHITQINREGQVSLYEITGGNGAQQPIVVKKLKPVVRGVIVVAKGAENATVHKMIAEAISRGLDVPMHRISVVPRKS
jgi:stage III sporulation protein AG